MEESVPDHQKFFFFFLNQVAETQVEDPILPATNNYLNPLLIIIFCTIHHENHIKKCSLN